ncbi:hypothetical protein XA68_12289 [Ophiocordyceps unilateralis]|uniref:PH-response regulator protein palI/RIM9 n=1 Tax=Ophiocordyceps unilateralis TaxID=268505 RepID=A0A2A9PEZ9_OPHUN|nr:hypothetical protein XA68_12289 [Ophiocordyceps unilateralis]
MVRPSTPLSVLLFAAFALLLASTISVPIVKVISLASFKGVNFGALGFCRGDSCSLSLGLNSAALLDNQNQAFKLPPNARDGISFALILHPVATALALAITIMSIASHLHSLAHSVRYLLILFVLIFVTFVVSLAAFLVDVILFVPHLEFGAFLTVAATIVLAISGIASCAMRRAVVSRLAHKRRVEENAEMSGENYNLNSMSKPSFTSSTEPTLPVVGSVMSTVDTKPQFAAFEYPNKADRASDDMALSSPTLPQYSTVNNMYGDRPPVRAGMAPAGAFGVGGSPMRGRGGFGSPPGRGGFSSPARGGSGSPGRGGVGLPNRVSPRGGAPPMGPPRGAVGARGGRGGAQGFGNATRQYDASPPYGQVPLSPRSTGSGRSRYGSLARAESPPPFRGRMASEESRYSDEGAYVPPRAGWNNRQESRGPDGGEFDVYSLYGEQEQQYHGDGPMTRTRSPAESERSGLTSISQRGVNPRWRGQAPPRRPSNAGLVPRGLAPQKPLRRPDVLLDNPDFALGGGGGGARRGGLGMTPGSAYPTTAF